MVFLIYKSFRPPFSKGGEVWARSPRTLIVAFEKAPQNLFARFAQNIHRCDLLPAQKGNFQIAKNFYNALDIIRKLCYNYLAKQIE